MGNDDFLNTTIPVLLIFLLTIAVVTDLRSHRIPNLLLLPALGLAVMLQTLGAGVEGLLAATGGFALGLMMLLPFYITGGMGAGDVKLLAVAGSFLGPWGALIAGLATMIAGGVLGIAVIVWHRCWPLLQVYAENWGGLHGTMLRAPSTSRPAATNSQVTKITYSPAIAAGTVFALWYLGARPMQLLV